MVPEDGAASSLTVEGQLPPGWTMVPEQPKREPYSSALWPLSVDTEGKSHFDTNAGLLGMVRRAVTLPGDIYAGQTPVFGQDTTWNPEMISRASELAALASPVNPAVRAGDMAIPGVMRATMEHINPGAPTAVALKEASGAGYDAARAAGLEISGEAVVDLARGVQSDLIGQHGIIPISAPETYGLLDKLTQQPRGGFVTLDSLEAARQGLGKIIGAGGREGFAAQQAKNRIDEFLGELGPSAVVGGPSTPEGIQALAQTLRDARGNYAAAQRSNALTGTLDRAATGIEERALNRAQATNSGMNVDNAIRQRVASLLERPQEVAGYSGPEIGMLNDVLQGGPVRNAARRVGNLLGGGGGLAQSLMSGIGGTLGGMAADTPGIFLGAASTPVVGSLAKTLANALARRSLNQADEAIRMRSPLYQSTLEAQPLARRWLPR